METFYCRECKQDRPVLDFWPSYIRSYIHLCKECHYKLFPRKGNRIIVPAETKAEIKNNFEKLTPKQLAKKYGVSDTTVYRILNSGHTKRVRERNKQIRKEFQEGKSAKELAEKYGLNLYWVQQIGG